jgi:hypothetical protein
LAIKYIDQIKNNITVIGLDRFYDRVPDFEDYNSVFSDLYPMIEFMYKNAIEFLKMASDLIVAKQFMEHEVSETEGKIIELIKEVELAKKDVELADLEAKKIDERITGINDAIDAKKSKLEEGLFIIGGINLGTVWSIAQAVITVGTAGGTLVGAIAVLPGLYGKVKDLQGKGMHKFVDFDNHKLKEGAQEFIADISKIKDNTWILIQQAKTLSQLAEGTPDQFGDLMAQLGELMFQSVLSNLRKEQAQLKLDISTLKKENAEKDLQNIKALISSYHADIVQIANASRNILTRSHYYADTAFRELFFAVRSLEIYALKDMSKELSFDYGHIHPDDEENAYSKFMYDATNSGTISLINLLQKYIHSWGELTHDVTYYNRIYRDYLDSGFVQDIYYRTFDEAPTIEDFRKTHELRFTVKDLPPGRYEPKITSIKVGLIGAKSTEPSISCRIEHTGEFSSNTLDKGPVKVLCRPATALVQGVTTVEQYEDIVLHPVDLTSFKEGFWGRGLETTWYFYIEEAIISDPDQNVDLSDLSQIKIAIQYNCFLSPS